MKRSHRVCERCHARIVHARNRWSMCEVCSHEYNAERRQMWREIKKRRRKKAGR